MKYFKLFEKYNDDINIRKEIEADLVSKKVNLDNYSYLYHGTSINGLISILKDGIRTYHHRELYGNFFCASINENMINLFGKGNGIMIEFNFDNVVKLPDFYYDLCLADSIGIEWENDENHPKHLEYTEKAKRLGLWDESFKEFRLPSKEFFFDEYLPKNVDALILPSFYHQAANSEQEVSITETGLSKLKIIGAYVDYNLIDFEYENEDKEKLIQRLIDTYGYDEDYDYEN